MFCYKGNHFYASTTKYFLIYAHMTWMYNLGLLFRIEFLIFSIVLSPITQHPFLIILYVVAYINSVTKKKGRRKSNRKFLARWRKLKHYPCFFASTDPFWQAGNDLWGKKRIYTGRDVINCHTMFTFLHCFVSDYLQDLNI